MSYKVALLRAGLLALVVALGGCPPPASAPQSPPPPQQPPPQQPPPQQPPPQQPPTPLFGTVAHVHTGQEYIYSMQGGIEISYVVKEVFPAEGLVRHQMTTYKDLMPIGDPVLMVWGERPTEMMTATASPNGPTLGAAHLVTVGDATLRCRLATFHETKSWITVDAADRPTFPGLLKAEFNGQPSMVLIDVLPPPSEPSPAVVEQSLTGIDLQRLLPEHLDAESLKEVLQRALSERVDPNVALATISNVTSGDQVRCRYELSFKGIPVLGAHCLIEIQGGRPTSCSAQIPLSFPDVSPRVDAMSAISGLEGVLGTPRLCLIFDPTKSARPRLIWLVSLRSRTVAVDAMTGERLPDMPAGVGAGECEETVVDGLTIAVVQDASGGKRLCDTMRGWSTDDLAGKEFLTQLIAWLSYEPRGSKEPWVPVLIRVHSNARTALSWLGVTTLGPESHSMNVRAFVGAGNAWDGAMTFQSVIFFGTDQSANTVALHADVMIHELVHCYVNKTQGSFGVFLPLQAEGGPVLEALGDVLGLVYQLKTWEEPIFGAGCKFKRDLRLKVQAPTEEAQEPVHTLSRPFSFALALIAHSGESDGAPHFSRSEVIQAVATAIKKLNPQSNFRSVRDDVVQAMPEAKRPLASRAFRRAGLK